MAIVAELDQSRSYRLSLTPKSPVRPPRRLAFMQPSKRCLSMEL